MLKLAVLEDLCKGIIFRIMKLKNGFGDIALSFYMYNYYTVYGGVELIS